MTHLPVSASHVLRGRRPARASRAGRSSGRTGRPLLVSVLAVASIALADGAKSDGDS